MDSIILLALGAVLYLLGMFLKRRSLGAGAAFSKAVNATVVALETGTPRDQGEVFSYPVFEYEFSGRTYRTGGREAVGADVKAGEVYAIWINPDSPGEYCLSRGGETVLSLAAKGFGAFLALCAVLILVLR